MSVRFIEIKRSKDLPHWTTADGTYFITFRLADSLPRSLPASNARVPRWLDMDRMLDRGHGSAILKAPTLASIVSSALRHFDGDRYLLRAWCVMPNHVHVVATIPGKGTASVVHTWKSFTANQINKVLGRTGPLWQRDYFDYLVRDEVELARVCHYVAMNPSVARMRDWQFVWISEDVPSLE
jgi:REP element-mobilizing transposase RayT